MLIKICKIFYHSSTHSLAHELLFLASWRMIYCSLNSFTNLKIQNSTAQKCVLQRKTGTSDICQMSQMTESDI